MRTLASPPTCSPGSWSARCIRGDGALAHAASRPSKAVATKGRTFIRDNSTSWLRRLGAGCGTAAAVLAGAHLRAPGFDASADRIDPRFLVLWFRGACVAAAAGGGLAVAIAGAGGGLAIAVAVGAPASPKVRRSSAVWPPPPSKIARRGWTSSSRQPAAPSGDLPTRTRWASPPPLGCSTASCTCGLISTPVRMKSSAWLCAAPSPSPAVARKLRGRRSSVNSGRDAASAYCASGPIRSGVALPGCGNCACADALRLADLAPHPEQRAEPTAAAPSRAGSEQPGQRTGLVEALQQAALSHGTLPLRSPAAAAPAPGAGSRTGRNSRPARLPAAGCCRGSRSSVARQC